MKYVTFWCPFIGNVGTAKAVLQSARSLAKLKIMNVKLLTSLVNLTNIHPSLKKTK